MTIEQNGTFNATSLTDFSGSVVTITPDRTFNTAGLTNIDNARFTVQGGASYGVTQSDIATTSYTTNQSTVAFSSEGAGTALDLSTLQSIDAGWYDNSGTVRATTTQTTGGSGGWVAITSVPKPTSLGTCLLTLLTIRREGFASLITIRARGLTLRKLCLKGPFTR